MLLLVILHLSLKIHFIAYFLHQPLEFYQQVSSRCIV